MWRRVDTETPADGHRCCCRGNTNCDLVHEHPLLSQVRGLRVVCARSVCASHARWLSLSRVTHRVVGAYFFAVCGRGPHVEARVCDPVTARAPGESNAWAFTDATIPRNEEIQRAHAMRIPTLEARAHSAALVMRIHRSGNACMSTVVGIYE